MNVMWPLEDPAEPSTWVSKQLIQGCEGPVTHLKRPTGLSHSAEAETFLVRAAQASASSDVPWVLAVL